MFNFNCHGRSVFYWCVFSAGWTLKGQGETDYITAHTGESVLLPCSCTDLNSSPDTFSWSKYNTTSDTWEEISSESDQYRVQLFNNLSPDAGVYRCNLKMKKYRYYYITVKGCTLENNQGRRELTARSGESVLLPCFCTTLHFTPETFSWKKLTNTWTVISSESDQYRNRVQLFNNLSPANLSLLISHLTEEDDGGIFFSLLPLLLYYIFSLSLILLLRYIFYVLLRFQGCRQSRAQMHTNDNLRSLR
uniref:Ig-like domain-containing protein n=1 Tax=Astyanax mexicanus TaxID=7994 RepID=A0A8B9KLJ8_ASTMX